ncbi:DUF349 domain-containing protein [Amnibacterium endophyticum]|uniref:DUF349 domain-containing protein n=1 Tax=Amnibacterium endophyticum TaxID=2109337 RepID=A0ABW4LHX7_9MICO
MTTSETGPTAESATAPWGRVDDRGVVFVRDGDSERQVGEFPDATPEEALSYYERKYTDLASQVGLLEQRARRGAPPAEVARAVSRLAAALESPAAVGDLQALRDRVAALTGTVEDLSAQRSEEHRAQVEQARADRLAIVEEAERLAARDPSTVQWKATGQTMDALFARWQEGQRSGARLPKGEANELWKRFRDARAAIDGQRRAYFAELDATQGAAKEQKERIVARAESLAGSSADPIGAYRGLLDEWKRAGRAGRKVDDALWARFRAAGDALYAAKAESRAAQDAEYGGNLEVKLALLEEAEPLLQVRDAQAARSRLTGIQRRWDEAGRVPRDQVRHVEDRLRKVEQHVAALEQEHWRRTDPETKARSEGLASQLNAAIGKLERELADAQAAGDRKRIKDAEDALNARRIWLDAIG